MRSWSPPPKLARLGLGIAFALSATLALLMQPEPVSLLAPLFGPWAGILYGHHDCTLATDAPSVSVAVLAFGVLAWTGSALATSRTARAVGGSALVAWAVSWSGLATASVLNTTI